MPLEKENTVGQLISSLVHELRNPLSSIKMGLTTLSRRAVLLDQDRHCLDVAMREAVHMERMLSDLLELTKLKEFHFTNQNINIILEDSVKKVKEPFQQEDISIHPKFNAQLPSIRIDTSRIAQLMMILFNNAKDALPKGGKITLHSDYLASDNKIQIELKDNGHGIKPEHLHRVFDPFFSAKEDGSGMGLTVAKHIVEAHGGSIQISSEIEKGTVVRILLPT